MENKNEIRESVSHLSLEEKKLKLKKFFNKIISVYYTKEIKENELSEAGEVPGTLVYVGETLVILKDVNNYEACINIKDINYINSNLTIDHDRINNEYKKDSFLDHIFSPEDCVIVTSSLHNSIPGKIKEYNKIGIIITDYSSNTPIFIPYNSIIYIKKD